MNINQAKSIAGIKYSIKTREDYARAERDCVNLIIAARKSGDENRAAELGGAKSIFQKRSRTKNRCAVCGETIARGATHCRIHARQQKSKLISLPSETPKTKLKRNNNARVYLKPSGGPLAEIGFYSNEVADVFKKWAKTIHPDTLKSYYIQLACPVIQSHRGDAELRLPVKTENSDHWQAIFELGGAIANVMARSDKPGRWLLLLPSVTVGNSDGFKSLDQISAEIMRWGGPSFRPNTLSKELSRLKMTTEKKLAKWWKNSVQPS